MTSSSSPISMIIDCDPGHDDAMALVVAARHANLIGVTTVAGNAPISATTRNARIVLDMIGSKAPLHQGANRPLVAPPRDASYIHGKSGLDGADLPEPSGPADSQDAVGFIIDTCRATEGVWLVPTGPLTNIALALRSAPDIARRIAGISLMGGGSFGNRSAAAEFNIWADPEAAAMVFEYGGKLIMSGLDVTHKLQATPQRIDKVRALSGHLASVLADLFVFFSDVYVKRHDNMQGGAVHDPCAVLALTHPQLFTTKPQHVVIELNGEHTRGMTMIDQRGLIERLNPNCEVVWDVQAEEAFDVIVEAIGHYSKELLAPAHQFFNIAEIKRIRAGQNNVLCTDLFVLSKDFRCHFFWIDGNRSLDLARVTTDLCAPFIQNLDLVAIALWRTKVVVLIGMLCNEAQRKFLATATNHDWDSAIDWLRVEFCQT